MDWKYIAGFFDGEGTIAYNGKGFRIAVTQTNKEVLDSIKEFSGLGNVAVVAKRKPHWKDQWIYYIAKQKDVYKFLKAVSPFLIVKRNLTQKSIPNLKQIIIKQISKNKLFLYRKEKSKQLRKKGLTYREIGGKLGIDWGYARRLILDIK